MGHEPITTLLQRSGRNFCFRCISHFCEIKDFLLNPAPQIQFLASTTIHLPTNQQSLQLTLWND